MSTSFIYHALGLTGYEYVHQKFINGGILIKFALNGIFCVVKDANQDTLFVVE